MTMNTRDNYDAIIIGGGHNGLTAAALLAKAQQQVLVIERRSILGGAAATEEISPGVYADAGAMDAGLLLPHVRRDLNLENHGLHFIEPSALIFSPQPDGRGLTLWRDAARTQAEIERFSPADARKFPDFVRFVGRVGKVLAEIMILPPPSIPELRASELLAWVRPALEARRLGGREMMELLRVLPMPAADFLDEWFESSELKGALVAAAVCGMSNGPRASGTAFMLLYQSLFAGGDAFRAVRFAKGGAGAVSSALARAAQQYGAEICTGVGVERILLAHGAAAGVLLENGRRIASRRILSNLDPQRTFFDLVGAPELEVSFVRDVRALRLRAAIARIHLVLSGLPRFPAAGVDRDVLSGHIVIAPGLDAVERAYDDAKYGQFSRRPLLAMVIPTLLDPQRAPQGMHLMSVNMQYTPYRLSEGEWDSRRDDLLQTVLDTLETAAPGLRALVKAAHVRTPLDLERDLGLTGGDIYHGQMGLDQLLFMRPVAGYGRYTTPISGLYLCGAGAHPGGGLTGAPGYNAARVILQEPGSDRSAALQP